MHVTAYRGPQAAQESDKVDRENASEQMDKAPAEIHALIRRVAYETQPPRNADDADGGNGVHGELDIDGTGGRRRAVAQGLFRALVENRHGQRIHERGEIQQQNGTDEAPDRRGAVEALFPADGLNKGDMRQAIIPGWLMSYKWYGSEQEFINNETGSNAIYEIKVVDPIKNIVQWQVDSIGRFLSGAYADHDFGYLGSTLEEKLGETRMEAKDSSDMYGFYFIEIDHGEELKPIEGEESADDDEAQDEEKEYDWEDSHFYTTSGSNDTTIYINYVGRLLNGKVFDTNVKRVAQDNGLSGGTYEPVAIQWGDSYQALQMGDESSSSSMIQGFAMTLWRMHPFGKAIGIFYSNYGYGYSGSGNTIPAYSPLMFEIEVVENPDDND